MLTAGDLKHRVRIDGPRPTSDNVVGEPQSAWEEIGRFWANVRPVQGREVEYAKQLAATVTHKVRMRWTDRVNATCRLVFGGREFAINAVIDPAEDRRELNVYCTEKVRV
jgi:SPP1 family predicted phage head-tail adaptor